MLTDLLNPENQIMCNVKIIEMFDLNVAAYISQLLIINDKAIKKGKINTIGGRTYFNISRKYITDRLKLTTIQQRDIDNRLNSVKIIYIDETDPDHISFDVEALSAVIGGQVSKTVVEKISKTAQFKTKEEKDASKLQGQIKNSKRLFVTGQEFSYLRDDVKHAYCEWIDRCAARYGYMSQATVRGAISMLNGALGNDEDAKIIVINGTDYNNMKYSLENYFKTHGRVVQTPQNQSQIQGRREVKLLKDEVF